MWIGVVVDDLDGRTTDPAGGSRRPRPHPRISATTRAHSPAHGWNPRLSPPSALYAEAAERWHGFGNVRERAYALLGQGRSLVGPGKREAEAPLNQARELFALMGYKPALLETEALLGSADAAAL